MSCEHRHTKEYSHRLEFILKSVHGISSDVIMKKYKECFGLNDFDIYDIIEYVEYVEFLKMCVDFETMEDVAAFYGI